MGLFGCQILITSVYSRQAADTSVMRSKGDSVPIITLSGYIEVPDDDLDDVVAELPTHIEATQAEKGCIQFEVYQDKGNRNRFNVLEIFKDRKSFEYHQERTAASQWAIVSANAKRHYEIIES